MEFCPCGEIDDSLPMIACDGCDNWFHVKCVGIRDDGDELERIDQFFCSHCSHLDGNEVQVLMKRKCTADKCKELLPNSSQSKYCSEECGIRTAQAHLYQILVVGNVDAFKVSTITSRPCVDDQNQYKRVETDVEKFMKSLKRIGKAVILANKISLVRNTPICGYLNDYLDMNDDTFQMVKEEELCPNARNKCLKHGKYKIQPVRALDNLIFNEQQEEDEEMLRTAFPMPFWAILHSNRFIIKHEEESKYHSAETGEHESIKDQGFKIEIRNEHIKAEINVSKLDSSFTASAMVNH